MTFVITIKDLPKMTNSNWGSWKGRAAEARKWKMLVGHHVIIGGLKPDKPFKKARLWLTKLELPS